jgi:hypothetical protein
MRQVVANEHVGQPGAVYLAKIHRFNFDGMVSGVQKTNSCHHHAPKLLEWLDRTELMVVKTDNWNFPLKAFEISYILNVRHTICASIAYKAEQPVWIHIRAGRQRCHANQPDYNRDGCDGSFRVTEVHNVKVSDGSQPPLSLDF